MNSYRKIQNCMHMNILCQPMSLCALSHTSSFKANKMLPDTIDHFNGKIFILFSINIYPAKFSRTRAEEHLDKSRI